MKKIFVLLFYIQFSLSVYAEIYKPENLKEIKEMVEDIFSKRNPEKVLFVFPLEQFILRPIHPALQEPKQNYTSILTKVFNKINPSKRIYVNELILLEYKHELSDPLIIDLINYIQENKSGIFIVTPNLTGEFNKIKFFDIWTLNYLKSQEIDLSKGIFANKQFIFDKEMKKINGTYPTFYKGLLSLNTDGYDNSTMQVLSALFVSKLKNVPEIIVAVSDNKNYLEALEKQLKILNNNNEFFGILYNPSNLNKSENISPEEYLKFWQDFVKKLDKVTRGGINLKLENPYEE